MASPALLVGTVLMGALLVALVVGTSRVVQGSGYEFHRVTGDDESPVSSEVIGFALTLVVVAVIGVGLILGDTTLVLFLIPALALLGFIAWGAYDMAQSRGLPTSAAVGLSAWVVGVLVFVVIGLNLLLA